MKNKTEEFLEKLEQKADNVESGKGIKIFGVKIWTIMAYFVIYSFLGYIIETLYGLLTKGVLESRKSFLYGPFCGIYGLGAVIIILSLQYFKKNNYTLFLGGYIIGSLIEYFVSLFGELILNVKWWDYSLEPFNINGRICLSYSVFWGILAIYLIKYLNPLIDNLINKVKNKLPKYLLPIFFDFATIFLIADCTISGMALNMFYSRLVHDFDLDIPNAELYRLTYEESMKNEKWFNFTEQYFSNEKMLKTYPNLKLTSSDGKIIFIKDLLSNIKPYYIKFFDSEDSVLKLTSIENVTFEE